LNLPLHGSDISLLAELALQGKFVELPDRLLLRRFTAETTGFLSHRAETPGLAQAYQLHRSRSDRVRLHLYRFVTTARAPIDPREKLLASLYLVRRVLWMRTAAARAVARLVRRFV
jgi:hypothetical protein